VNHVAGSTEFHPTSQKRDVGHPAGRFIILAQDGSFEIISNMLGPLSPARVIAWIFSPEPTLWICSVGIGGGLTLALANQRRNIKLAHFFFLVAWIWAFGCVTETIMFMNVPAKIYIPLVFFATGTLGTLCLVTYKWVERNHVEIAESPHPGNAPAFSENLPPGAPYEVRSYLVMKLIIDSIDKNFIQFHFSLKNVGPQEIKILHFVYKSSAMSAWEGSMEPTRVIIPNGEVVVNGSILRTDILGNLNGIASYAINGFKAPMTADYGFRIRSIDLRPQRVLEPTSRGETTGEEVIPTRTILDGLRQPVGSFTFWFPEKLPDGSPDNILVSAGPTRQVAFDPNSRMVHFTMLSKGKLFHLKRPLLKPKEGLHFVAATWDDAGNVHLYVDGKE
jgi:hypothetical protein